VLSQRDFEARIGAAMVADQHRLRNLAQGVLRQMRRQRPHARELARFEELWQSSSRQREQRERSCPAPRYDDTLPIHAHRAEIAAALSAQQVLVICGETGSGKSTQLPKICLDAGYGIRGMIGHTQPRRIAARAVAARVADELRVPLGRQVGFKIRFTDVTNPETHIKVMTDGILLAETQHDRFFEQYDALIIDEAHERSLNVDFLLGYLKRILPKRPDLRLIITSATIDADRFARHFGTEEQPAPVIHVSGRTYPVEVRYRPVLRDEDGNEQELAGVVGDALSELLREGEGDVLVFLPTERDIRDVAKTLRGRVARTPARVEILPLYARLSTAEQNKVFQLRDCRRVVLATNVAESSLTVPGIRFVIDTGTARISRYSPRSKVQRLPIEPVSRASADQRQGRCGRLGPGVCIRLFSEDDYLGRDRYTTPEIRRTNLAAVILQMLALRLGALDEFPFLDPPRPDAIRDGYRTLYELGAIDRQRQLTDIGRRLHRLPVDPRIGRMILAAEREGCLHEVLIIAAALEIQDPRERPTDKEQLADEKHALFAHEESDFLSLLQMWDQFHQWKRDVSGNRFRRRCQENYLSYNRLREWQDVHRQLRQLVEDSGFVVGARRDDYDAIHRALLTGLLSNIALRRDRYEYLGADGGRFYLWPGSAVFAKRPAWVVSGELVETQRRYLRTVARISSSWVEPVAGHLVKRTYSDPFWSYKRGTVLASEKVTLFGLTLVAGRRVPYGPVDPDTSRHLFIQHALVEGDFDSRVPFFQHNRRLVENLRALGARSRQSHYLISDRVQYNFYSDRLPLTVYDAASLREWMQSAPQEEVGRLHMRRAELLSSQEDTANLAQFPESLTDGELSLDLEYRFEPGEEDDGLSITVPREALGQLNAAHLEWMVPGLLEEKLVALIRSLPKPLRRNLLPAPDTARRAAQLLPFGEGHFLDAVARTLSQLSGEFILPEAFSLEKLSQHLRMNVRVTDDAGTVIGRGRDLQQLRLRFQVAGREEPGVVCDSRWHRDGMTQWDLVDFPERVEVPRGDFLLVGYPALLDRGRDVSLRLLDHKADALRATRGGLRRLFYLAEKRELQSQVHWLPRIDEMELFAASLRPARNLRDELTALLAQHAFVDSQPVPRSVEQFAAARRRGEQELPVAVQDLALALPPLFEQYHRAHRELEEAAAWLTHDQARDMRTQLDELTGLNFLVETPWDWLLHYPRYFRGICLRLEKLRAGGAARDAEGMAEFAPHLARYRDRARFNAAQHVFDEQLEEFRWMLEEFRISLFAQQAGTALKVSSPRLDRQWSRIR
jgi:ATP-dependent helicase HrpA